MPERYFDPEGLTEPHTTQYTLTVYIPPRPRPRWLPSCFMPQHVKHDNTGSRDSNSAEDCIPCLGRLELRHLDILPTQSITITSSWFLPEMRCKHLQAGARVCDQGCYLLEKGGKAAGRWRCTREDCDGHAYCGQVVQDGVGQVCFGKKNKRMVCLVRMAREKEEREKGV